MLVVYVINDENEADDDVDVGDYIVKHGDGPKARHVVN